METILKMKTLLQMKAILIVFLLQFCLQKTTSSQELDQNNRNSRLLLFLKSKLLLNKLSLFKENNLQTKYDGNFFAKAHFIKGTSPNIVGSLHLYSTNSGVVIIGTINGLLPGFHGFHIHENGQTTNNCDDAGGHFNPTNKEHGNPTNFRRHTGDLGNIYADRQGSAIVHVFDGVISLDPMSENYVGGKTFVVDEKVDRYSDDENPGSKLGCATINIEISHRYK